MSATSEQHQTTVEALEAEDMEAWADFILCGAPESTRAYDVAMARAIQACAVANLFGG